MSTNPLIKYYEVLADAQILDIDDYNKVGTPMKSAQGKKWMVQKGKYVKSFGNTIRLKTTEGKKDVLILVNGNGITFDQVKLYADHVDDCGCDGNPVATLEDLSKVGESQNSNYTDSATATDPAGSYLNKPKFNRMSLWCLLIGAVIGGLVVWYSTKDKKKTLFGILGGAVIGLIIGYFMGRRGTTDVETDVKLDDTVKDVTDPVIITGPKTDNPQADPENNQFLQIGSTYDFKLPGTVYAMMYSNGVFYIARNNDGTKVIIKSKGNTRVSGKLVEVTNPQFFMVDPIAKKIVKIQSNKPLPFIDLGNKIYMPLSMTDPSSLITMPEVMDYLSGADKLDDEIYVKGRYAGLKKYNLMYMPLHEATIRNNFGQ